MTLYHPKVEIEWEPTAEGIYLALNKKATNLPIISVTELRDDMNDAYMLSRGYERLECLTELIMPGNMISIGSNWYEVTDTLEGSDGNCIIQFTDHSFHDAPMELSLPDGLQLTVYTEVR